ncbi:unnamed protein product [Auanema sp. JU1783]|nr:unnamed protein product [Auanema sp. JU1783]
MQSVNNMVKILGRFLKMPKRAASTVGTTIAPIFAKKTKVEEKILSPVKDEIDSSFDTTERKWTFLSWNVAGLRAIAKRNSQKEFNKEKADVIFLSETKCKEWPVELESDFKGYHKTLVNSTVKNGGYAGVAVLSKVKPIKIWKGIDSDNFDNEGRMVTVEFPNFFFIGCYVPNSGRGLVNLDKRENWEKLFMERIKELDKKKPVIYAGDLNVAHNEIDLANPASNRNKTPGFTDKERQWFTDLLDAGFKDTYRELHPDDKEYSFWSYMGGARAKNVGWRLDYYVISERIMEKVIKSNIQTEIMGSDHAPVYLEINI